MGFLSLALTFIGYLLVYAGVANHGRFATAPWLGVLADAYAGGDAGSGAPGAPGKKKGGGGPGLGIIPKLPVPQGPITGIPFSPVGGPTPGPDTGTA